MLQNSASPQDLIDAMQCEKNPVRRSQIITQLGAQGVVEAVEPLIKEVLSNEYQSGAAISALGSIGDPRAVGVLIQSFRHQTLGWVAKDALVRIGTPVLEPLIAALHHENPDFRFLAVRTLAELHDPSTLEPLQAMAERDPNTTNRQAARHALKSLLLDTLSDERADVRLLAVRGLQRLGDARTIEPLQALITSDPDDKVRRKARAAIIPLVQGVEQDPFDEHNLPPRSRETSLLLNQLQRQAGATFARVASLDDLPGEAATVAKLLELAQQHADDSTRQMAHDALIALCTDYLRCVSTEARGLAVRGLASINAPGLRDMLEPVAAYDPAETVRQAAQDALDGA